LESRCGRQVFIDDYFNLSAFFINAVYSLFKKFERLKEYVIFLLLAHSLLLPFFIAADLMMFFYLF
jgi:hypothetical protein